MLSIDFNPINFLGVVVVAHLCNLFVAWFIHFLFHQNVLGIPLYKIHLNSHHRIEYNVYSKSDYYWAISEHVTSGLFFISSLIGYHLLFSSWVAWTFCIDALVYMVTVYYLHAEYGNKDSWLSRYYWFKKDRLLHKIHHSYDKKRFMNSKNYAFGGPMAGHLMDRLFGTYQAIKNLKSIT
ncbi:MAG: sterol desaturase family protein [Moorea sp. SIO3C2]|nr:sterol desaturase family protein [Moorena sp. SIO3C2]